MIRGTTAQFNFKLPYTKEDLAWATIKFWQPNNSNTLLPVIKQLADCSNSSDPNKLCVSLTSEETSRFSDKHKARVQLIAQHASSGTVFGTKPELISVYPMPDDIIIDQPDIPPATEDGLIIFDGEAIISE